MCRVGANKPIGLLGFSSLSAIARSFELAMPQYLDDSAPRFGRKLAKDLKMYHVGKGLCGPDLISKYIWHLDSQDFSVQTESFSPVVGGRTESIIGAFRLALFVA
ncbi:unnamed protein product [Toxocara canis]|uniref:UmuC domain-containing protein n=1 Tax=Toxocara canis TaxID=6265 RepID=A0A183VEV6_TOXCA|nr:unnamed protein product [Toxocara canis]